MGVSLASNGDEGIFADATADIFAACADDVCSRISPFPGRWDPYVAEPGRKKKTEASAMSMKRSMLLLMLVMFVGTVAGKSILPKSPKLCIPCTNYCKTHPNSPRCL